MAVSMPDLPPALVRAAEATTHPSLRIVFYYVAMFGTVAILGLFLPVWMEFRGLSEAEIGVVMAAASLTRVAVNPLAAHVADVTGRRKRLVLFAAAGACVALACATQAYGFWMVIAVMVVAAACQGPVLPVGENLCLLTIRVRGLEYGRLRAWGSVAFIVVSLGAGRWLETPPDDHIILLLLAGWLIIFAAVACLPDLRSPPRVGAQRGFRAGPAMALLRDRRFPLLLAAAAANMSAHAALYGFSSLYWLDNGISKFEIGVLWTVGVVAEIVLFWMSARIVGRFGPGWLMALGAGGAVVRWIGTGLTTDLYPLMALQTLHGLTFGAAHLGAMTYLQRYVPAEHSATGQALYSALGMGAAMALVMPLTGWLYADISGDVFFAMAGLAAIGLGFAVCFARSLERDA